jgi:hypothetical protein
MRIYLASVAPGTETGADKKVVETPRRLTSYYFVAHDDGSLGIGSRRFMEWAKQISKEKGDGPRSSG